MWSAITPWIPGFKAAPAVSLLSVPRDVLELEIVARLSFRDQLAFGATCRLLNRITLYQPVRALPPRWPATDALLSRFPQLTQLNCLNLKHVSDAELSRQTLLVTLTLSPSDAVKGECLRFLSKLTCLNIQSAISADPSVFLSNLKNLVSLEISSSFVIPEDHLSLLLQLTHLAPSPTFTNAHLARLPQLRSLSLSYNNTIGDGGLSFLTSLQTLLLAKNNTVSNAGLVPLTNLLRLDVDHNNSVNDAGWSCLTNLRSLRFATYAGLVLRSPDSSLACMIRLETLALGNVNFFTDHGVSPLVNLTSLSLNSSWRISGMAFRHLPRLRDLNLHACQHLPNTCLLPLTSLTHLSVSGCSQFDSDSISHLTTLSSLELINKHDVTNRGLCPLTQLTSLRLHFRWGTAEGCLTCLTNLKALWLPDDQNVAAIRHLTSLTTLTAHILNDATLRPLVNLQDLTIMRSLDITDAAILALPSLQSLAIYGKTRLTPSLHRQRGVETTKIRLFLTERAQPASFDYFLP